MATQEEMQQAQLEQAMRQAQQQQAIQQGQAESELEEKVNEPTNFDTVKNIAYLGAVGLGAYMGGGALMLLDAASLSIGFMGGKILQKLKPHVMKDKEIGEQGTTTYHDVLNDGIVGGLMGMFVNTAFGVFGPATTVTKFLFVYPLTAVFMPLQFSLDYLKRNYNPITLATDMFTKPVETVSNFYNHVYQKMSDTFAPVFKYMLPFFGLASAFAPRNLITPIFGGLDVVYGAATVGEAGEKSKNISNLEEYKNNKKGSQAA
jgi:hypothetical protein